MSEEKTKNEEQTEKKDKKAKKGKNKKQKAKFSPKYHVNLIRDENKGKHKASFLGFGIFLIALAIFMKFGIYDQLAKVNKAESEYNKMLEQVNEIKNANKEYDEVKAKYDEVTDWYMTDEEKIEVDKINVFEMLEQDMLPYVEIESVQIKGNTIVVQTGVTNLNTVSKFLDILQSDERNGFVTITTASASNGKDETKNDITANIQIIYGGAGMSATTTGFENSKSNKKK